MSWGPCWYAQKAYFEGKVHPLSTPDYLMRYDVEVSGFPSSHAGHLCLLRLKEDDYPGTTRIEEWPSWDLPILQWGKSQGGVVGFSHSGWGLKTSARRLPNLRGSPFRRHRCQRIHRRRRSRRGRLHLDRRHARPLGVEHLVSHAELRIPRPDQRRDGFPCIYGERVGLGRVYVKLADGKLDFDRWCEGLKAGRSYVGDGRSHLVDFRSKTWASAKTGAN